MSSAPAAYVAFPITSTKLATVSSVPSSSSSQDVSSIANKKKLGKNLNKLVKQPELLVNGGNDSTSSKNNMSRNGLLLLSTKRGGPVSSSLVSGLINTKPSAAPRPINTSSLKSESALYTNGNAMNPGVWQLQNQGVTLESNQGEKNIQQDDATHDISSRNNINDSFGQSVGRAPQENGGINQGFAQNEYTSSKQETQEEYMARLAKEKSEKRRMEEEMRVREQRERTERRLMELESRKNNQGMQYKPTPSESLFQEPKSLHSRSAQGWYDESHGQRETLVDRSRYQVGHQSRTLFDPYRNTTAGSGRNSIPIVTKDGVDSGINSAIALESQEGPSIRLLNYENSDRGEVKNTNTRMLFDPKSGSMVTVRVRDDTDSLRPKKEKSKASKKKDPNDKNLDESQMSKKGTKRESKVSQKTKGRSERKDSSKLGDQSNEPRQPKTVSSAVSIDRYDGDKNFGSRGVSGSKMRKASGHGESQMHPNMNILNGEFFHLENDGHFQPGAAEHYFGPTDYASSKANHLTRQHFMKNQSKSNDTNPAGKEELPWNLRVKPNEKIELVTGMDDSPTLQASAAVWAPSETTIAALRNAVHSARTTDAYQSSESEQSDSDVISESEVPALTLVDLDGSFGEEEEEEDDDDDEDLQAPDDESPSMKGLGFDPTENMDLVMMSPSMSRSVLDPSVNVGDLNLSDQVSDEANTFDDIGISKRFLSSTWSSTGSMVNLNNWDYLHGTGKSSTGDGAADLSSNILPSTSASSFLSMSLTKGDHVNSSSSSHSLFNGW